MTVMIYLYEFIREKIELAYLRKHNDLKLTKKELEKTNEQMRNDIFLAKKIQENILHSSISKNDKFIVDIRYKPLIEVGGDIYSIDLITENKYRIFLADATGHGVQAAFMTMLIVTEYNKIKNENITANLILEKLNYLFISKYEVLRNYFTCVIVDIDFTVNEISYSFAGHPYQVFISDNTLQTFKNSGVPMGFMSDSKYKLDKMLFKSGDKIILYSDGIYEEFSQSKEILGIERMIKKTESFAVGNINQCNENIFEFVKEWVGQGGFHDDITLIGIEFKE